MARTQGMWRFKLIYSQGIYSSLAQLIQGCTPYCSQAYDNDIETRFIHKAILLQKIDERKGLEQALTHSESDL
jgi:hypothetical protein